MKIAIMGTGRMARGLAKGWARTGHTVHLGSRTPEAREETAQTIPTAAVSDHAAALEGADVVVIAIPYTAVEAFARRHAGQLRGKVVIDITNPFDNLPDNRVAGAEITATAIGAGARVVAAFKDNFWATLDQPASAEGIARDVHLAGDDEEAKQVVAGLAAELDFQPLDCGPLRNARILDSMVPLMIELDQRYARGQSQASWKLLAK
jgi:8-hydroxy-5-deazaflavin:NADPH oxidoreductase